MIVDCTTYEEKFENKNLMSRVKSVATLCDEPAGLTCSVDAARHINCAEKIVYCQNFEDAASLVKRLEVDALLVPGAYPGLNPLIMDRQLEVYATFVRRIPPLLFAIEKRRVSKNLNNVRRIYHHPAVAPLLGEILGIDGHADFVKVSSNSAACKKMIEDGGDAACVTNGICSSYYGLEVVQVLRKGILMPWILMGRSL